MSWSLNELEAEVKKAIRGAGLPWGLAEEGGKAIRWLAARGVDPIPALNDILARHDRHQDITTAISMQAGRWQGEMAMCPIALGAALSDGSHLLLAKPFVAGRVAQPLLFVPCAASAARILKRALRLDLNGMEIMLTERGDPCSEILAVAADLPEMRCEIAATRLPVRQFRPASLSGIDVDPVCWASLSAYVHRTYVPASERSRREGAGAGLIDND